MHDGTLYDRLDATSQACIDGVTLRYRCTMQEVRELCEAARDLAMWGEPGIDQWWAAAEAAGAEAAGAEAAAHLRLNPRERKKRLIAALREHMQRLRSEPTRYDRPAAKPERPPLRFVDAPAETSVFGDCPVRSDRTLCCNLKTIDAVQNCSFGCSYCTIQTFYGDRVAVDRDLGRKLREIELDSRRFYHIGTGQSSDSLVWGNRAGMLDELCRFAGEHPNVLLELKTKSANVSYFLDRSSHDDQVPANLVCSWSLNTAAVIEHEEHFTASLERRLAAARRFADGGRMVAFHFHPMVHYDGWDTEYPALAGRLLDSFAPEEVAFLSMGSVTFIKPVIKQIRERGEPTRILQAELVADPHGKLTYPDELKVRMFRTMYRAFAPWHGRVFMYLCMEKATIWDQAFGWRYASNDEFERAFGAATLGWPPGERRSA